ncbi:MAG: DUF1344 domain-containing protein [Rhizobiaceae bacterium]|nr:DUF1344 domain-containing protein [Rhizobiaceae bacterium]
MRMLLATLVASIAFVGAAFAGEVEGTVQSVDMGTMSVVLEDGSEYKIGEGVSLDGIAAGTAVKINFDDDTKTIVTIDKM